MVCTVLSRLQEILHGLYLQQNLGGALCSGPPEHGRRRLGRTDVQIAALFVQEMLYGLYLQQNLAGALCSGTLERDRWRLRRVHMFKSWALFA